MQLKQVLSHCYAAFMTHFVLGLNAMQSAARIIKLINNHVQPFARHI